MRIARKPANRQNGCTTRACAKARHDEQNFPPPDSRCFFPPCLRRAAARPDALRTDRHRLDARPPGRSSAPATCYRTRGASRPACRRATRERLRRLQPAARPVCAGRSGAALRAPGTNDDGLPRTRRRAVLPRHPRQGKVLAHHRGSPRTAGRQTAGPGRILRTRRQPGLRTENIATLAPGRGALSRRSAAQLRQNHRPVYGSWSFALDRGAPKRAVLRPDRRNCAHRT